MILTLLPDRNTPHRSDWSGAFSPEARLFVQQHGGVVLEVPQDLPAAGKFRATIAAIEQHQPDVVAYFGHGLRRSLPQLGITLGNVDTFGAAIAAFATAPRVVLYACSAADGFGPAGDGGLADGLRDAMVGSGARGAQVDAHRTAGHTTHNPHVRRFLADTTRGGVYIVEPESELWRKWVHALKGPMRFKFPFLTIAEIHAALAKEPPS